MEQIKPGDIVYLKSGSPPMIVGKVSTKINPEDLYKKYEEVAEVHCTCETLYSKEIVSKNIQIIALTKENPNDSSRID